MTGVAQAADSIEDLASFLGGEPEKAHKEEEEAEETQEGEEEETSEEEESEEETEDPPEEPESRKVKVPVKDENGQETGSEEIEEKELVSGYMRQKAFTQKTMELAQKEKQAAEIVQQRVTEASQYAQQQAQLAKNMVIQLAGLKSEEEMRHLANADPTEWIQEQERVRYVTNLLGQLDASIKADQDRIEQTKQQKEQEQNAATWTVLTEKGIDRQKLTDIYANVTKNYGVTSDQLGKVLESGLVLALKDALAYRELQDKKPQVTQKVKEAERLPTAKKSVPASERVNRELGERFNKGRAKLDDLASFLSHNKL
jgi:hypothetical protein